MRPALQAVAARNAGPFTRQDALRCGYTERELKTLTGRSGRRAGDWVVLARGVYADRVLFESCDADGRYLLQVRARALTLRTSGVFSHASAAVLHTMPLRPRWQALVHVTRPDVHGGRSQGGVKHHRAMLGERSVIDRGGLRFTDLARTGVDIAREHGFEDGVVALDAALRMGAGEVQLQESLEAMSSWAHVGDVRAAVEFADAGAHNPGESLMRVMLGELGLGKIETQYLVTDGYRTAYADARIGRHLFEFDGRVKYVERDLGGVAYRPPGEIVSEEKRREDWLRRTQGGHGVSRVIWSELFGAERRRTQRRIVQEVQETVRRFGPAEG